jgi:hypothetical protein
LPALVIIARLARRILRLVFALLPTLLAGRIPTLLAWGFAARSIGLLLRPLGGLLLGFLLGFLLGLLLGPLLGFLLGPLLRLLPRLVWFLGRGFALGRLILFFASATTLLIATLLLTGRSVVAISVAGLSGRGSLRRRNALDFLLLLIWIVRGRWRIGIAFLCTLVTPTQATRLETVR